jgi:DeoR family transcriptional regulator of aga operon
MSTKEKFTTAKRRTIILNLIEKNDHVDVVDLSKMFSVSEVTIRNDLSVLEESNLLVRARGGAMKTGLVQKEIRLTEKNKKNTKEKVAIGKLAATLIKDGDTILFDSGSTTEEIAKLIKDFKDLTIVTNALNIVSKFIDTPTINVIVPGGKLRQDSFSLSGIISEKNISQYYCDKLFLGVDAIDVTFGIFTPNIEETNLNIEMIRIAKEVIVVTDSSKFNKRGLSKIADITAIHTIVTDSGLDTASIKKLEAQGIKVMIAKVD